MTYDNSAYDFELLGDLIIKGYEESPHINTDATQIRIDDVCGICVITVVGSNEDKDWDRNFDFRLIEAPPYCARFPGKVHKGFFEAFAVAKDDLVQEVLKKKQEGLSFVVQGHSQGSAVGQLVALYLRKLGCDIKRVVAWAGPRVGNKEFCIEYDKWLAGVTYHIIRQGDPVPLVPFAFMGYRRTGGIMHYWTIDGKKEGQQSLASLIKDDVWAWINWRLKGNFDMASDNYHSFSDYAGLYGNGK